MSGELTPMPLVDILGAVGYRTAMGSWPPGFDEAHALLTLVNVTERLRLSLQAHHDAARERIAGPLAHMVTTGPCPICVRAQGADPADVLTDTTVPPAHQVTMEPRGDGTVLVHCRCGWASDVDGQEEALAAASTHVAFAGNDPRGT